MPMPPPSFTEPLFSFELLRVADVVVDSLMTMVTMSPTLEARWSVNTDFVVYPFVFFHRDSAAAVGAKLAAASVAASTPASHFSLRMMNSLWNSLYPAADHAII